MTLLLLAQMPRHWPSSAGGAALTSLAGLHVASRGLGANQCTWSIQPDRPGPAGRPFVPDNRAASSQTRAAMYPRSHWSRASCCRLLDQSAAGTCRPEFSAGFDLFDLPDRLQVRRREGPQEAAGHQGRPQVRPGHWGRQEAPPLQARHRGPQGDQEVSSEV